ncbi:MAG TPA: hypothetical protein VN238_07520, partial [Solirubrobacteraceae bacterium]|nr:hypothetical protein [Solirubrobacteraceae bacterium]
RRGWHHPRMSHRRTTPLGLAPLAALIALLVLAAAVPAASAAPAATAAQGAQLACTKDAARIALQRTTILDDELGAFFGDDFNLLTTFVVGKVICRDLTGDGAREMTVTLECCTVSSPRPLVIFGSESGEWAARYALSGLKPHPVWNVKASGRAILFRSPVWRRDDALCCPSSFRKYRVVYTDGRFRLRRR